MDIKEAVIQLHDIARLVEQKIGIGQLSESIRKNADNLDELVSPFKVIKEKENV